MRKSVACGPKTVASVTRTAVLDLYCLVLYCIVLSCLVQAHIEKVARRADSWKEGQELWEAAKAKAVQASAIRQMTL
eukprot:COSAG06_NODE_3032_length_5939_cov_4.174114_3_plen_77_part_00